MALKKGHNTYRRREVCTRVGDYMKKDVKLNGGKTAEENIEDNGNHIT